MNKGPFDLTNLSGFDKRKEAQLDNLSPVLEENGLVRKQIPEGPGSLLKAISDSLYFTTHYNNEIQQFCINHLKFLISNNKLPPRLQMFKNNITLLKDFIAHPNLSGFDKAIMELVSVLFKVKVVLYNISEDNYLHSTVVNNKFEQKVEIIKSHNNHCDAVKSKKFMAAAGICQNILLNIVDNALNSSKTSTPQHAFRDINGDNYINIEYESWVQQKDELLKEAMKTPKVHHKKSLSDTYKSTFESKDDLALKNYNMFTSTSPPDEFLKLIAKETEDNVQRSVRFLDEPWFEIPQSDLSIKNYPMTSSNLSSRVSSIQDLHVMENDNGKSNKPTKIFFNDSLTNTDLIDTKATGTPRNDSNVQGSPIFFAKSPPPGLTPSRYPQKTYSVAENLFSSLHTPEKQKPTSLGAFADYTPDPNLAMYNLSTPPHHGQYGVPTNAFMRKTQPFIPRNLTLPTGLGLGDDTKLPELRLEQKLSFSSDKKKPIILDEGKQRHTGRLKFFDENKNYGFIIMDEDGSDIFVHFDDLQKAGINKELLKATKLGQVLKLAFNCMKYIGKYDKSRKATDIQLLN